MLMNSGFHNAKHTHLKAGVDGPQRRCEQCNAMLHLQERDFKVQASSGVRVHQAKSWSGFRYGGAPRLTSMSGGSVPWLGAGLPAGPMAITLEHTSFLAAWMMAETVRGVMSVERMKSRTASWELLLLPPLLAFHCGRER